MAATNDKWTRRDFIVRSSMAGVGLSLMGRRALAEETGETTESLVNDAGMPLVVLGKTGERVSILGLGGAGTVAKSPRLLPAAVQKGITFIDTAEGYDGGNSERTIGEYLEKTGNRKQLFIVTKTGNHNAAKIAEHVDGSLERLRTDYVDLLYLHNLKNPDLLDDEMKAAAEALKKSGKIRFFGFSCHDKNLIPVLEKGAECGFVDAFMLKYNFRDYDDEALSAALDACEKANLGIIAMKTGAGAVPNFDEFKKEGIAKAVISLKATWADPRVDVIVSKMANLKQVEENSAAAKDRKMSRAEWDLLERYARATDHLYCRGCGQNCEPALGNTIPVAEVLRYKMYYEGYGERAHARRLFASLPVDARQIAECDYSEAEAACPYGVCVGDMMREAAEVLG